MGDRDINKFRTSRFGEIEVPKERIISFDSGIIGFKEEISFVVIKHRKDSSFFWLQSLKTPQLAFSMLFPFEFSPLYKPNLTKEDLNNLSCCDVKDLEIYSMVVIPKDPMEMTMNLLSPIVVNPKSQLGAQILLKDSNHSVYHRVIPAKNPSKAGASTG